MPMIGHGRQETPIGNLTGRKNYNKDPRYERLTKIKLVNLSLRLITYGR